MFFCKENFNSDDQQLHQYRQTHNHLTSKLTEHKNTTTTYDVGNRGPELRKAQNMTGLNRPFVLCIIFCQVEL